MKRTLLVFLAACFLFCCCSKEEETIEEKIYYQFTDALERTVTLSDKPQRVAALLGSYAQIWTLAGGEVIATADDAWEDFDLNLSSETINLGSTENLSMEKLLSAEPDFIIASSNRRQNMEWQETLENTGIPVAYFDVNNFSDYLNMLKICCDITGQNDLYQKNGVIVQEQINMVIEKSAKRLETNEAPTVLTMRASASIILAKNTQSTVLGEILSDLGCVNVADSDETLLDNLSIEQILEQDPDYIFFIPRGDDEAGMKAQVKNFFKDQPAWSELTAVKEGHVYFMDKSLYGMKPTNRWGEAYEKVEDLLYDQK